jgi:hypothetical protein
LTMFTLVQHQHIYIYMCVAALLGFYFCGDDFSISMYVNGGQCLYYKLVVYNTNEFISIRYVVLIGDICKIFTIQCCSNNLEVIL